MDQRFGMLSAFQHSPERRFLARLNIAFNALPQSDI